jgi:hypothetical protein
MNLARVLVQTGDLNSVESLSWAAFGEEKLRCKDIQKLKLAFETNHYWKLCQFFRRNSDL